MRDSEVVDAGKMGVIFTGGATLLRTRITGSKGLGLFIQEDAHVHVDECLVEGSQGANVEVKSGYASFHDTTIRGSKVSGVNLQGEARVLFSSCEIEDNAVVGTRPDPASGARSRMGYAIQSGYYARAELKDNALARNPRPMGAFTNSTITDRWESATSAVISMPRTIGPGCMTIVWSCRDAMRRPSRP